MRFSTSITSTATWSICAGAITKVAWGGQYHPGRVFPCAAAGVFRRDRFRTWNCLAVGRLPVDAQVHRLYADGGNAGPLHHLADPAAVFGGNPQSRIPVGAE